MSVRSEGAHCSNADARINVTFAGGGLDWTWGQQIINMQVGWA